MFIFPSQPLLFFLLFKNFSASAPAFAGLLLQVRGALLSSPECKGRDIKFGHVNPMIYWAAANRPDAFTDITVGNNIFDGQGDVEQNTAYCGQGYVATEVRSSFFHRLNT